MNKICDFFKNVLAVPLPRKVTDEELGIARLKTIAMGSGSRVFHANQDGMWLGAVKFADAPFHVDMEGNAKATSLEIAGASGNSISGTITVGTALKIDGPNEQFVVTVGAVKRAVMGKISAGVYGFEVRDASNDILFNHTKIKMQYIFSTFLESANEEGSGGEVVGVVNYADSAGTAHNKVVRLDFYKPSNFVLTGAVVQTICKDSLQGGGGAQKRFQNATIYLNPSKTLTTAGGGTGFKFWRFSGGNAIRSGLTPTSDGQKVTDTFTSGELSNIANGWNTLILQSNTNTTVNLGYAAMNLVLTGYLT